MDGGEYVCMLQAFSGRDEGTVIINNTNISSSRQPLARDQDLYQHPQRQRSQLSHAILLLIVTLSISYDQVLTNFCTLLYFKRSISC